MTTINTITRQIGNRLFEEEQNEIKLVSEKIIHIKHLCKTYEEIYHQDFTFSLEPYNTKNLIIQVTTLCENLHRQLILNGRAESTLLLAIKWSELIHLVVKWHVRHHFHDFSFLGKRLCNFLVRVKAMPYM